MKYRVGPAGIAQVYFQTLYKYTNHNERAPCVRACCLRESLTRGSLCFRFTLYVYTCRARDEVVARKLQNYIHIHTILYILIYSILRSPRSILESTLCFFTPFLHILLIPTPRSLSPLIFTKSIHTVKINREIYILTRLNIEKKPQHLFFEIIFSSRALLTHHRRRNR